MTETLSPQDMPLKQLLEAKTAAYVALGKIPGVKAIASIPDKYESQTYIQDEIGDVAHKEEFRKDHLDHLEIKKRYGILPTTLILNTAISRENKGSEAAAKELKAILDKAGLESRLEYNPSTLYRDTFNPDKEIVPPKQKTCVAVEMTDHNMAILKNILAAPGIEGSRAVAVEPQYEKVNLNTAEVLTLLSGIEQDGVKKTELVARILGIRSSRDKDARYSHELGARDDVISGLQDILPEHKIPWSTAYNNDVSLNGKDHSLKTDAEKVEFYKQYLADPEVAAALVNGLSVQISNPKTQGTIRVL